MRLPGKGFRSIVLLVWGTIFIVSCRNLAPHATAFPKHSLESSRARSNRPIEDHLIKLGDSLYAYDREVTRNEYHQFRMAIKDSGRTDLYESTLYDSLRKYEAGGYTYTYSEPLEIPFSHPALDPFPISAIDFRSARSYCQWLTQFYHQNENRKFRRVVFRLPRPEEWMLMAQKDSIISYGHYLPPIQDASPKPKKGKRKESHINPYWPEDPTYTYAAPPNELGCYEVYGNVAEMTSVEGIAKGGSFRQHRSGCHPDSVQQYTRSEYWLGFRVFMEVIEQ